MSKREHLSWRVRGLVMARSYYAPDKAFICGCCMKRMTHEEVVIDHIMPLALGGTNDIDNLDALCARCNSVKGAMHPADAEEKIFAMLDAEWEQKKRERGL